MATIDLDHLPLVPARNFTPANRTKIDLVVLHSMEAPEKGNTAESVAAYFAGKSAPQASAHFCVDADSIIRCVKDKDVAWAAPGANSQGVHIEQAGYASQTTVDWQDAYSVATLHNSADLARALCARYAIPKRFVRAADLTQGERGITTHAEVSRAWRKTDHTDPGTGFPIQWWMALVVDADPHPPQEVTVPPAANKPFVTLLVHPPSGGYLEVGEDGGVFAWGGAPMYGSLGGVALNQPIVDAAWTPDYGGYYLIGRDGGVFAFGNARHQGNALWTG